MKLIEITTNGLTYYEAVFKYHSVYTFTFDDMIVEIIKHKGVTISQFFKFNLN